jgi:hypothetical protein
MVVVEVEVSHRNAFPVVSVREVNRSRPAQPAAAGRPDIRRK